MVLLRNLLVSAARRIAADPEVQAKAAETYETSVKPRLASARDELRDLAGEIDPMKQPGAFARRLRERLREVNKRG
ncbi:hypothetical protein AAFN88_10995 [Pelagibius sp. CAU 1746]|uniref:hypothetical protein n=1 Tax=Pelagibius sp. CAU 1746 TaxID=3140370 RepID=UPI00325B51DD